MLPSSPQGLKQSGYDLNLNGKNNKKKPVKTIAEINS